MAKTTVHMKGLKEAMKKLEGIQKQVPEISMAGLIKCAIVIQRSMDKESPTVPADTRNLQASFFIVTPKNVAAGASPAFQGEDSAKMASDHAKTLEHGKTTTKASRYPLIMLGFSAHYAEWVHEKTGMIHWSREGSGAKFFEAAINRNLQKMLGILKSELLKGKGGTR